MHSVVSGFEYILRGGFMMYPLLISGLVALTVILERLYALGRAYKTPRTLVSEVLAKAGSANWIKPGSSARSSEARSRRSFRQALNISKILLPRWSFR